MAKGYQANKERMEAINMLGKAVGKRAGFKCEWCESKEDLRLWDYQPDTDPDMEAIALLCQSCREFADGRKAGTHELQSIRNALWSTVPAVAEGAARVMVQCHESWVRDAIDQSFIDDGLKEELLKKVAIWK